MGKESTRGKRTDNITVLVGELKSLVMLISMTARSATWLTNLKIRLSNPYNDTLRFTRFFQKMEQI